MSCPPRIKAVPLRRTSLPRQGIPPAFASWDAYAEVLQCGAATGTFASPQTWWWELRLHPRFGTLEFRVPDAQSTVQVNALTGEREYRVGSAASSPKRICFVVSHPIQYTVPLYQRLARRDDDALGFGELY